MPGGKLTQQLDMNILKYSLISRNINTLQVGGQHALIMLSPIFP